MVFLYKSKYKYSECETTLVLQSGRLDKAFDDIQWASTHMIT